MTLIITPLKNAFLSLSKALNRALGNPDDLEVRDGCIQRFKYTYDFAIQFLKLSIIAENIDQINFYDLLIISNEMGLIKDVNLWFSFREARNNASYAYNDIKANEVFGIIPQFSSEAQFLISELEKKAS